jgi:hypothetical protein
MLSCTLIWGVEWSDFWLTLLSVHVVMTYFHKLLFVFSHNLAQTSTVRGKKSYWYPWRATGTYPVVPRDRIWFGLGVGPHLAQQEHIIPLFDRTRVDIGLELNLHRGRVCIKTDRRNICIYFHRQMKSINIRWTHPGENKMKLLLQLQRGCSWEISPHPLKHHIN